MEYILKSEIKEVVHKKITNRAIANKLGITEGYVSQIMNGRKTKISKLMAYAFCKAISQDLEITDLFEIL